MLKKDIAESLRELVELAFVLRLKKRDITMEEFEKMTDKLHSKLEKLQKEIGQE